MKVTITYDISRCGDCPYKAHVSVGTYCRAYKGEEMLFIYPEGRTTIIDNCPIKEQ